MAWLKRISTCHTIKGIPNNVYYWGTVQITIGDRTETVNFFHTHKRGVDRIFVDHPLFLAKVVEFSSFFIFLQHLPVLFSGAMVRFRIVSMQMDFGDCNHLLKLPKCCCRPVTDS